VAQERDDHKLTKVFGMSLHITEFPAYRFDVFDGVLTAVLARVVR
jgi:hypothetical protein